MHIIFLVIALIFNAIANILMKAGMLNAPDAVNITATIKHYLTSWPVIIGIFLFALNILAYTQALIKIPISIAYPVMTGSGFAIIGIAGIFLFKERLSHGQMLGICLIFAGIFLVAQNFNHSAPDTEISHNDRSSISANS